MSCWTVFPCGVVLNNVMQAVQQNEMEMKLQTGKKRYKKDLNIIIIGSEYKTKTIIDASVLNTVLTVL